MTLGLVLLALALAARGASRNHHVRGRLLASSVVFAAYGLLAAVLRSPAVSVELQRQLQTIQPLLLAFGAINACVALVVNPWRVDRLPDRFPKIVQDAFVIVLFAIAATFVLQERVFTTTAVGAVVIGFALQDTLGNLFAGLAIQIEKPFRVGHWVSLAGQDGLVQEITWRATKVRTKAGNFVIVPNSVLSRDTITNYSAPTVDTRVQVDVGASYGTPPNEVKAVILDAIRDEPLLSPTRQPEVFIVDFAASAVAYQIWAWTNDFATSDRLADQIRSAVYYAFRRKGIEIPYPIQVEISRPDAPLPLHQPEVAERALASVEIFSSLDDAARGELARAARSSLYAAGEVVVRQGSPGSSMFVIVRGEAVVTLETGREVARLGAGGFFGEMSLLTGASRTATVRASIDSELLEITAEAFRQVVLANPAAIERIGAAVAARAAELDQHRALAGAGPGIEAPHTFLSRVRRFLRL
jgi:small-conductance mechanosensitive channel/CRP-like cAMP-binding protein